MVDALKIDFAPSVYEHAAFLINRTPWEVSQDKELMYQAHRRAHLTYGHSPIVVGIDIYNLEAEAYGAKIRKQEGTGIPAVEDPVFSDLESALEITPFDPRTAGRIPDSIACGKRLKEEFPGARVSIPVSGPFSIASNLRTIDGLLVDLALNPEGVSAFLSRLVEGQLRFCRAVIAADLDIALFESAAAPPLLSPGLFREIELPAMQKLMAGIDSEFGIKVPFIIGGDTAPILESILSTGTDFVICPAETDRGLFMETISDHPEVTVRVNMDAYLCERGPVEEILAEADQIMALQDSVENRVVLGTGAVPYSTPPEHILAIKEYVR